MRHYSIFKKKIRFQNIPAESELNYMKITPDGAIKILILTGIYEGNQTFSLLREYVEITP